MKKKVFKKLILAFTILYSSYLIVDIFLHTDNYLWDFKVYYSAGKAVADGENPYDVEVINSIIPTPGKLSFVYPPITLTIWYIFSLADYSVSAYLFLILKCAMLAVLIVLWMREFLNKEFDILFLLFLLFAYRSTIYLDLSTGNVTVFEQVLIWFAFYFFLKERNILFCALIFVAALFKLTPLLFLVLLVLANVKNKYLYVFGTLSIFLILQIASYVQFPSLGTHFIQNIGSLDEKGVINPSLMAMFEDIAIAFSDYTNIQQFQFIDFSVFLIFAITIAILTFRYSMIIMRCNQSDKGKKVVLFLVCLGYALILPRFKNYAFILLIVPSYFLMRKVPKLYLPLFILIAFSPVPQIAMTGFYFFSKLLGQYYSIIMAFCVWISYLISHRTLISDASS